MLAHRVIPIVLHRGHTVVKGSKFNSWRSVGHVMQAIRTYQKRGVDELVLLDIAATPEGRGPDFAMVEELSAELFCPLTVGGGVRSVDDVRGLLRAGGDKVAICSAVVEDAELLQSCADRFGSQAVVFALDVKEGRIASHCGARTWDSHPTEGITTQARCAADLGAGEILLTSIDREGTMAGYDLDLIRSVSEAVDIPVIANGGCSGYEDMENAIKAGASAVAAGALFTFTDATPREAAIYLQEHGIEARV
jgi:cyclase